MSFWDRLFGHQEAKSRSKDVAKQRLQVVLVHDRTRIRPGLLDAIRDEIVSGISKHIEVDKGRVELSLASEGDQSRLVADIPLKVAGRPRQRLLAERVSRGAEVQGREDRTTTYLPFSLLVLCSRISDQYPAVGDMIWI